MNKQEIKFFLKLLAFLVFISLILNKINHSRKIDKNEENLRNILSLNHSKDKINNKSSLLMSDKIIKSECECKKDNFIVLQNLHKSILVKLIKYKQIVKTYQIQNKDFENYEFTCNYYSSFMRGQNQKIIAYSLYGKGYLFYYNFVNLVKKTKHLLPDWIIRVYYDDTIDFSVKCKIECLISDDSNHLIDNVDFCHINKLPVKNSLSQIWSASFMHAMMWRWLPIGDSFVDVFLSRDLDSHLIQREIDAVNDWFTSNKTAHIMRDHPDHGTLILGGMWGFYNSRDRQLANDIYQKMIDKKLAMNYNFENRKGNDQFFLTDHVYHKIKEKSKIHDSFLCNLYHDSEPFPTKRQGALFVSFGSSLSELEEYTYNRTFHRECPIECRPKDHQDWIFC